MLMGKPSAKIMSARSLLIFSFSAVVMLSIHDLMLCGDGSGAVTDHPGMLEGAVELATLPVGPVDAVPGASAGSRIRLRLAAIFACCVFLDRLSNLCAGCRMPY